MIIAVGIVHQLFILKVRQYQLQNLIPISSYHGLSPSFFSLFSQFLFTQSYSLDATHIHPQGGMIPTQTPGFPVNQKARNVNLSARVHYELFKMAKEKTTLPHLLQIKVFKWPSWSLSLVLTHQMLFCSGGLMRFLERFRFSLSCSFEGDWDPPKPLLDSPSW